MAPSNMQSDNPKPMERLYRSVVVLASAEGRIQERLAESFWQHLCHVDVSQLPPSVRDDFAALCAELKAVFTNTGRVELPEAKAGEYARRLILIYDGVLRAVP